MRLQEAVEPESGQQPVLASKLRPPRLNHVLLRPRLLSRANPVNKLKLVNICAGPGFGKTTLMAQIAQAFEGNSVWYQIDNLDRDPAVFLRHLIAGITHAGGFDSTRARSRMNETTDFIREGESIIAVFIDELSEQSGRPLLICFDDFHLFDEMEHAPRLVEYLIQNLPENVRVAIASRSVPKLSLGRLRSHGTLCDFGERELQFNLDELKELVDKWEIKTTADAVAQLHKSTEGWAAGLVLTENYLRSGNQAPDLFSQRQLQQNVYEYLAEEVLNNQPPEIQDFLMKAALIDPIDPSICRMALDMDDAARILEQAERHNLFTARLDDAAFYRYHPLFREFLLARLQTEAGEDSVENIRIKYAEAFIVHGKEKEAIDQYLEVSHFDEAVELIEKVGNGLLHKGEHQTLIQWFDILTDDHSAPLLKLFHAKILITEGKSNIALDILQNLKKYIGSDDNQLLHECSLAHAECLKDLNKPELAVRELKSLLNMQLTPEQRLEAIFMQSINYCYLQKKNGARNCANLARTINRQDCSNVNIEHFRQGDFPAACLPFRDLLNNPGLSLNQRCHYMNNYASGLELRGKYNEAYPLAAEALARIRAHRLDR